MIAVQALSLSGTVERNRGNAVGHLIQRFLIWHSEANYIQCSSVSHCHLY